MIYLDWEDDYDVVLTNLLAGPLTLVGIHQELDDILAVAGATLDADPNVAGGPATTSIASLKSWWTTRHRVVQTQVNDHP